MHTEHSWSKVLIGCQGTLFNSQPTGFEPAWSICSVECTEGLYHTVRDRREDTEQHDRSGTVVVAEKETQRDPDHCKDAPDPDDLGGVLS